MKVHDIGKMALLASVLICATVALLAGRIDSGQWQTVTVGVTGYLAGNGVNALRGVPGSPALASRDSTPALVVGPTGNAVGSVSVDPSPASVQRQSPVDAEPADDLDRTHVPR